MSDTPLVHDGGATRVPERPPSSGVHTDLEELVGLVAHELRTPLAVVTSAAETLLSRVDSFDHDELERLAGIIDRNSRLAALLLDRLGLARDIETGSVELTTERTDLALLVRQSVDDLGHLVLREHPTTLSGPDEVAVRADVTALREIMFNLLANAAKYSHTEAPIDVLLEDDGADVSIVVRNHGSGVTPADTDRIFEPYVQTDPSSSGVGLGLFISRGLARAHDGELSVRPAATQGSEFVLRLPTAGPSGTAPAGRAGAETPSGPDGGPAAGTEPTSEAAGRDGGPERQRWTQLREDLIAQSHLFENPPSYRAGVEDALRTMRVLAS